MAKSKQLDIFERQTTQTNGRRRGRPRKHPRNPVFFGGSLMDQGHPRIKRPLHTKKPIHVTMRSSVAQGKRSLLNRYAAQVTQTTLGECAKRAGVRIYRYQNVGNHIHLVIRLHHRQSWIRFVRSFTSLLKLRLERLWREKIERLFDQRPFTRVCSWGREFRSINDYFLKNYMDRWGIPRTAWNLRQFKVALAVNVHPGESDLTFASRSQQVMKV